MKKFRKLKNIKNAQNCQLVKKMKKKFILLVEKALIKNLIKFLMHVPMALLKPKLTYPYIKTCNA